MVQLHQLWCPLIMERCDLQNLLLYFSFMQIFHKMWKKKNRVRGPFLRYWTEILDDTEFWLAVAGYGGRAHKDEKWAGP